MRKKAVSKLLALGLSAAMMVSLAACGGKNESGGESSGSAAQEESGQETDSQEEAGQTGENVQADSGEAEIAPYPDEQTWDHLDRVTLYPFDTNTTSGLVTGYKADVLDDRVNGMLR